MYSCTDNSFFQSYVQAGDPQATSEVLKAFANHEDYRVRRRVAENIATPVRVLVALAKDPEVEVRIAVGTNVSTPAYIQLRLCFDQDLSVRLGLAQEAPAVGMILDMLIDDDNAWIANQAKRTIQMFENNCSTGQTASADFSRYLTQFRRQRSSGETRVHGSG